jgi:hypothetical protein
VRNVKNYSSGVERNQSMGICAIPSLPSSTFATGADSDLFSLLKKKIQFLTLFVDNKRGGQEFPVSLSVEEIREAHILGPPSPISSLKKRISFKSSQGLSQYWRMTRE